MRHGQTTARYGFGGQEKDDEIYGSGASYTAEFWQYDTRLARRWNIDPKRSASISPYAVFGGNPVRFVDPDGGMAVDHIDVEKNQDGTYTVVGGEVNADKNIYVVNSKGNRTGEVVGQTLTEHSFFNEENQIVTGVVINPNDNSGEEFLNDVKDNRPNLINYIFNARNKKDYDFKSKGIESSSQETDPYHLRGMPLGGIMGIEGNNVYGTARDVGNIAAGYVGAASGLVWDQLRTGFDAYQSYKSGRLTTESPATQSAQRIGYNAGRNERWMIKLHNKIFK